MTGFSSHPLLSLIIREGKSELNLTRLAFTSSPFLTSSDWCWVWELKCCGAWCFWNLKKTHVRKRKMERRNGKACGLFKKKMRDEREMDWDWDWRWLSNGLLGFEFLLGFGILQELEKWGLRGLVCWVLLLFWVSVSGIWQRRTKVFSNNTWTPFSWC